MDLFTIATDSLTFPSSQDLGFPSLSSRFSTAAPLSVSASISPVDSIAPPATLRPNLHRTAARTRSQRKRRTRRASPAGGSADEGDDGGLYGDGGDGSFGGGGRGWNSDGQGGASWEGDGDDPAAAIYDPAFDFVYQVVCWIVLSACVHFALKKIFCGVV